MIDYLAIHRKRQSIAKNTGACVILRHMINIDAHIEIKQNHKAEYIRSKYGIDFAAYSRIKKQL